MAFASSRTFATLVAAGALRAAKGARTIGALTCIARSLERAQPKANGVDGG
jgi:hypothetical protein